MMFIKNTKIKKFKIVKNRTFPFTNGIPTFDTTILLQSKKYDKEKEECFLLSIKINGVNFNGITIEFPNTYTSSMSIGTFEIANPTIKNTTNKSNPLNLSTVTQTSYYLESTWLIVEK